jgi:hypothetical protein
MNNQAQNNLVIYIDDSDDSQSENDSESDIDVEEEDLEDIFSDFASIFIIFESDSEICKLSYNEKILLVNMLNSIPFLDYNNFERFKEQLLLFRVNISPAINYYLLKKINNNKPYNALNISSTISNFIYNQNDDLLISDQSKKEINKSCSVFYNKLYASEQNHNDSMLMNQPDEILESIILKSLPDLDLDLKGFFTIRNTCKRFHRIMNSKYFLNKILQNYKLTESFTKKFYNVDKINLRIYKNIVYEFIFTIFKNYLLMKVGSHIIKICGGFDKYFSLPFIDNFRSECVDNICGSECANRYHFLHLFANAPVSRGIDNQGRLFLLFFYKTSDDRILYEFIYNNEKPSLLNITFSGVFQNTFIGNKSMNYTDTYSASYRPLLYRSYNYMERLIKGEKTGEIVFKDTLEYAEEDLKKPVSLYFEKDKLKEYIKTNYINSFNTLHSDYD